MGLGYWIGQALGILAIALGFLTYQVRTQRAVIVAQMAVAFCFVLHFLLIGAVTGMALNVVALIRNLAYFWREKQGKRGQILPIAFTVVMAIVGLLTWEAWYSVFMLAGLVINSYCMSFYDPQKVRASILVSSPMALLYDILVLSIGGAIYESVAVISAAVGLWRFYRKKRENVQ